VPVDARGFSYMARRAWELARLVRVTFPWCVYCLRYRAQLHLWLQKLLGVPHVGAMVALSIFLGFFEKASGEAPMQCPLRYTLVCAEVWPCVMLPFCS
jgi:hypothetical protein